jgi:manganese transport protein
MQLQMIGTAIALKLLFGIPLLGGALITALDAFLLLLLMNRDSASSMPLSSRC